MIVSTFAVRVPGARRRRRRAREASTSRHRQLWLRFRASESESGRCGGAPGADELRLRSGGAARFADSETPSGLAKRRRGTDAFRRLSETRVP